MRQQQFQKDSSLCVGTGTSFEEASEVLINARSPNCPETREQRNFILRLHVRTATSVTGAGRETAWLPLR